jgi:hypothetical protein
MRSQSENFYERINGSLVRAGIVADNFVGSYPEVHVIVGIR